MNGPIGSLSVERERHDIIVLIETESGDTIEGHIGVKEAIETSNMFREAAWDAMAYIEQETEE